MSVIDREIVIAQLEAKRDAAAKEAQDRDYGLWYRERANSRALALGEAIGIVAGVPGAT